MQPATTELSETASGTAKRIDWIFVLCCAAALLLLVAAFSNHFDNSFHFDDSHVIENNLYLRDLSNIPRFFADASTFSSLAANSTYRPLLSTTYAVDYWIAGGLKPTQFHITQFFFLMLLGAGLAVLYHHLFSQSGRHSWNKYAALLAAALFCLHTANTETVNYLSSRSDLLSTLFVVLAFLVYIYWPLGRRRHLYLIPVAAGALVKTPAVMFGPLLAVYLLLFGQQASFGAIFSKHRRAKAWSALAKALPALAAGAILFWFVESMNPPGQQYGGTSSLHYLMTQPFVWLHYLRLFFFPLGLTADTDWQPLQHWYDTRLFAGFVGIGLLAWIAWAASRRSAWRPVAFGLAWYFLALLPSSSIVALAEVANEHRLFFPYVGLCPAAVWGGALLAGRLAEAATRRGLLMGRGIAALGVLVLLGHAWGTHQRNLVWRDGESLWADVVQKSPRNGRAWMNYGLAKMSQGKYQEALQLYEQAGAFTPNYSFLEINTAIAKSRLGNNAEAEGHFRRALQLDPELAAAYYYYGNWLAGQERGPEAVAYLEQGSRISPNDTRAGILLLDLYYAAGLQSKLEDMATKLLAVTPNIPEAIAYQGGTLPSPAPEPNAQSYFDRGLALTSSGQHLKAALYYRKAAELDAGMPDAYNNLGWSLGKLGFFAEAVPALESAIRLDPDYQLAKNNLDWVRKELEAGSPKQP